MQAKKKLSTQEKSLQINLRKEIYGSFAEIGAGQEVAANFFKVGGASGTVAKTMSAYDMKFSDAIYGVCERYVCEDRLTGMLDHEYPLLPERLPHLIEKTRFFAFADTVEAVNYERTNQGQGWIGIRFQKKPCSEPNDCIIHVKMFDNDPLQQQYALGMVGVNMMFFMGGPQLGEVRAGLVASAFGVSFAIFTGGIMTLMLVLWAAWRVPRLRRYTSETAHGYTTAQPTTD